MCPIHTVGIFARLLDPNSSGHLLFPVGCMLAVEPVVGMPVVVPAGCNPVVVPVVGMPAVVPVVGLPAVVHVGMPVVVPAGCNPVVVLVVGILLAVETVVGTLVVVPVPRMPVAVPGGMPFVQMPVVGHGADRMHVAPVPVAGESVLPVHIHSLVDALLLAQPLLYASVVQLPSPLLLVP